ncbi:MAG: hypothetical protein HKN73_12055, partial [Gemmatimonadetes bacterium]|nr:hypothetical protein [Gemmatimonadota bacterium]
MNHNSGPGSALRVGALEGRRWAGLVLAHPAGGAGLGIRLRFTTPEGRSWDWEDWYWAASLVGTHAPDGSYAQVAFDLSQAPGPENEPRSRDLILEWSRGPGHVLFKARVQVPGTLDVVGDTPWDWTDRWATDDDQGAWRGRIGNTEVGVIFGGGLEAGSTQDPEACRRLVVGEDETRELTLAVAWDRESPPRTESSPGNEPSPRRESPPRVESSSGPTWRPRARKLLQDLDDRLSTARASWLEHRPATTGEWSDLIDCISDQIHWMVLLQPETGALYTPAGRRWIFPRTDRAPSHPPASAPATTAHRASAPAASAHHKSDPSIPGPRNEIRLDYWTAFGWDSFFNALALAVTSPELAWAALLAGLRTQYDNGNVPNWRGRFGGTPDRSQPPVGTFAALKLHLSHSSASRLDEAFPYLVRWSDWWDGEHDGKPRRRGLSEGLYAWGSDTSLVPKRVPPWEAGASGHQRAAWESGQDDLPLWDDVEWDDTRDVLAMSAVDLCSYRALDLECLARIAEWTGDPAAAIRARERYAQLVKRMNEVLWSEDDGLYLDELPSGHSSRLGASNFLPLIAGVPTPERARRMVSTLKDPDRFWGPWLLPSVSRDDPSFPDQQYWRGSIWPPMNYLVLQGLRRYGFHEEATILALRGAWMFLEDSRATGMCRENFDARTGQGQGRRFQSWGPLFALGAVEEWVRACPWEGTTGGCPGRGPAA